MKGLYQQLEDSISLGIFESVLGDKNKAKFIPKELVYDIWASISDGTMYDVLVDAGSGDEHAIELIKSLPYVDEYVFDAVGEQKGIVMLTWLVSAVAGMEQDPQRSCTIIADYFNNLIKTGGIDKFLGAGMEGFVIEAGDQIIKVFYKNMSKDSLEFYKLAKTKKYSVLPHISHLSSRIVSMEKLIVVDDAIRVPKSIEEFSYLMNGDIDHSNDKNAQNAYDEMIEAAKELGVKIYIFDANVWNIGLRKNGNVVFFDA